MGTVQPTIVAARPGGAALDTAVRNPYSWLRQHGRKQRPAADPPFDGPVPTLDSLRPTARD